MAINSGVLTVSDTLDVHPFPGDGHNKVGLENVPSSSTREDAIRARLADHARQDEKRRRLTAFLQRETPAWSPDDHAEIDAAGGAAAWVRKLRGEAEQRLDRRTPLQERE